MATSTILLSILVLAVASTCFAAVAWEKAREDPDYPDQCMWENRDGSLGRYAPPVQMYQVGESWGISGCAQATCTKLGDELYIHYASCGVVGAKPPCIILPQNLSLPYPECCQRPWCPKFHPQPVDSSIKSNEIEQGNWEDDNMYQNFYQLFL